MTSAEILQWRDRTLTWFYDPAHASLAESVNISLLDTQYFIGRVVKEIAELFSTMG